MIYFVWQKRMPSTGFFSLTLKKVWVSINCTKIAKNCTKILKMICVNQHFQKTPYKKYWYSKCITWWQVLIKKHVKSFVFSWHLYENYISYIETYWKIIMKYLQLVLICKYLLILNVAESFHYFAEQEIIIIEFNN